MKKKNKKQNQHEEVTQDELAQARLTLAYTMLDSENADKLIGALHKLTMLYVSQAQYHNKNKNKRKAKMWKHTADELFTVTMCAVYTKQDQMNGGE